MADVKKLLDSLGQTETEVAASLERAGIKGDKNRRYSCPVAKFLLKNGVRNPGVGCSFVSYETDDENCLQEQLPLAVRTFIDSFDKNGSFPFLEEQA